MPKTILIIASLPSSLRNFRGRLIEDLKKKGCEVHVAAPGLNADQNTSKWLAQRGIVTHDVIMSRVGFNPVLDLGALFSLCCLIFKSRPNLVVSYTVKPVIWGMIAAKILGVPKRVALITGLGYAFQEDGTVKRKLIHMLVKGLYVVASGCATKIIFQNHDDLRYFQRHIVQKNKACAVVSGSGVDIRQFKKEELRAGPFSFLLIARLLGDKGIREYVAAARLVRARSPSTKFILVGPVDANPNGLSEKEVLEWVKNGDVEWFGEQHDVRPFLRDCHVYVLPSYREGTPRTVLEAMSMMRAVITTDAPGCRETVETGVNGFLVPPRDAIGLSQAMMRFIEEPDLAERFGRKSREIAEEKYDVSLVNQDLLRSFEI